MTIDTHQGYKRLLEAGVPERQAEATVALFTEWMQDELVTKEHLDLRLAEFKAEIREEINEFKAEIRDELAEFKAEMRDEIRGVRGEMAAMEQRIVRRMLTLVGVAVGLLGTLMTVLKFIDV